MWPFKSSLSLAKVYLTNVKGGFKWPSVSGLRHIAASSAIMVQIHLCIKMQMKSHILPNVSMALTVCGGCLPDYVHWDYGS